MNQVIAERTTPTLQRHLLTLVLAVFTALTLCYCIGLFVYAPRNNDQSWLLYAAQRVLAGAHISGPELVETNPPLIIWFSVVPAFLGHLLHLDAYLMLKIVVFLMVLGSVAWCARILRITGIAQSPARLLIGITSVLVAEIFMSGYVLGEREHLVVILILPYILSAVLRASGAQARFSFTENCALGLAAGVAVCFKPQQVLILIGLELFLAIWARSLRRLHGSDFLCAVLAIIFYIGAVRTAAPLYFTSTLPLLRETYWAFGKFSTWDLICQQPIFDAMFILTALVLVLKWEKLRLPIMPSAFLACSLAASGAYYVQHAGLFYRAYPQEAMLILALLWLASDLLPEDILVGWQPNSVFAIGTFISFLLLLPPALAIGRALKQIVPPSCRVTEDVFAHYPPGTPAFLFSTEFDAFPALDRNHLVWASRWPCLWMLPAIIQNESFETGGPKPKRVLPPAMVKSLAVQTRTEVAEDFRRWRPSVIVVEQCNKSHPCWGLSGIDFDAITWFMRSPAFASEWKHYHLQARQANYDIYTRTD